MWSRISERIRRILGEQVNVIVHYLKDRAVNAGVKALSKAVLASAFAEEHGLKAF